jgi:hypothetical protein
VPVVWARRRTCYRIGHTTYVKRYGAWMRVGYGPSIARCGSSEETASGSGEHRV